MKELSKEIRDKRLFLLDIDGTIAFDSTLIDGTMDFMEQVLVMGGKYVFITNNSTKSIKDYIVKFNNWGIPVDGTSFLTSSYATAVYLKENYENKKIFVLGTRSFIEELKSFGLSVTEEIEDDIKAVVVGFDNELTYKKIEKTCELLLTKDVAYIATNPDLACPTGFGFVPDCGAICDMIAKAVKREPLYIGKPNRMIVDMALKSTGCRPEETLVIGDRLYTDIACGINGNVDTCAVFTGEAKLDDLKDTQYPPTFYCESIQDIYGMLVEK